MDTRYRGRRSVTSVAPEVAVSNTPDERVVSVAHIEDGQGR